VTRNGCRAFDLTVSFVSQSALHGVRKTGSVDMDIEKSSASQIIRKSNIV
jgi:hypothetical protein